MSLYCFKCNDYYKIDSQSPVCPHEQLALSPEGLARTGGWHLPADVKNVLDTAYRDDDRDGIRYYLGHSNPFINKYAEDKLKAIDLREEILKKQEVYEADAQGNDVKWLPARSFYERE